MWEFILFFSATLKKERTHPTLHTFANRTGRPTNQNLQKSAILPTHSRYLETIYVFLTF